MPLYHKSEQIARVFWPVPGEFNSEGPQGDYIVYYSRGQANDTRESGRFPLLAGGGAGRGLSTDCAVSGVFPPFFARSRNRRFPVGFPVPVHIRKRIISSTQSYKHFPQSFPHPFSTGPQAVGVLFHNCGISVEEVFHCLSAGKVFT